MHKKTILFCTSLLFALLTIGCNTQQTKEKAEEKAESSTPQLVGNDKDDHGCIASAGYQWSELKKDCVRPWEVGFELNVSADTLATSAAYLLINADTSKVEVFLPKTEHHPILTRDEIGHSESWSSNERKHLTVEHHDGVWTIFYKGKMVFTQK